MGAVSYTHLDVYKRQGLIKYITMAPEHDENFALTRYCRETGVVVSMGHSSATYEQEMCIRDSLQVKYEGDSIEGGDTFLGTLKPGETGNVDSMLSRP